MIKRLDNKRHNIAEDIIKLQKASYRVEAEIISFDLIPPLLEFPEDIINSEEIYYGFYIDNTLAGIVSYIIEGGTLDIYKVAVHPCFFKKGIATQLLRFIERVEGIDRITVATGLKNDPAVCLYTSLGFERLHQCEVQKGLYIISFEKPLKEQ